MSLGTKAPDFSSACEYRQVGVQLLNQIRAPGAPGPVLETWDSPLPHAASCAFVVNCTPSAFITASVVFRVGFPFALNDL